MMKHSARAVMVLACLLCSTTAGSVLAGQQTVRVPVAPPRLVIVQEGEREPNWRETPVAPPNEIILADPDGNGMLGVSPSDGIHEAAEALAAALPPDYLAKLMQDHGYEPRRSTDSDDASERDDLRQSDLADYLFDVWVFRAPHSRLAREFSCLSPGERGITPFLALLTGRLFYVNDGAYLRVSPGRATSLPHAAYIAANVATHACQRLVEEAR
ncbi:MAG: hypothetical protein KF780_07800 [Sphingomonas sp.]|nr:hypothetical protein [Sphingomonas sp.]